jgi:Rps23 Pro-64 3,4-dihydroxylase Tpa1-like proline 4-hydroxylase
MNHIDFESLQARQQAIHNDYQSKKPFRYTMFENFFKSEAAERIYNGYPTISDGRWDGTTYVDQKNKFQKTKFEPGSVFNDVFQELNSPAFLKWLEAVTGVPDLLGDDELFGGGLHQSIQGAFLNVHVDYNIHPETKFHRRLNVLVYMNKDWKDEYEGHLELWDLSNNKKDLLAKIAPLFNRCVIFETNEISYHGHPRPLKAPRDVNRKSIATYYYTESRPDHEIAGEHNTIYVNTEGAGGQLKRLSSAFKALIERVTKK